MTGKNILINCTLIAALVTGAAIPTSAQHRRTPSQQRKPTTQPSATTTATPAQTAGESPATGTTATGEPSKKNARASDESNVAPSSSAGGDAGAKKSDASRNASGPRYAYEFTQPEFDIRHVRIEHDASGRGTITFERKNEDQPFNEPIEISPSAFARIVAAWEALKFLDSQENYQSDKHFANLGVIRLSMKEGTRERAAQFDWTNNEQAAALRREYQRLTDQHLFTFDMEVARQYQPSETVKLLKRLEILLDGDGLSDAALVKPLLSDLSNDERIPLIARNQAARLLKRIEKEKK